MKNIHAPYRLRPLDERPHPECSITPCGHGASYRAPLACINPQCADPARVEAQLCECCTAFINVGRLAIACDSCGQFLRLGEGVAL